MEVSLGHGLLERERELAVISSSLERPGLGGSSVLVLEGPGGIGKSRLLAVVRDRGRDGGMCVLTARCSELEAGFPFGIVRQLFEPLLFRASEEQREKWFSGAAGMARSLFEQPQGAVGVDEDQFSRLHSLYWLCANIALERPLALVIDDVHWSDEASLGFLGFLIRRLEVLPITIALATRPPEASSPKSLAPLLADPNADVLRLAPLSRLAVESWVQAALGESADPAFSLACHQATHGNPLLMKELLREIEAEQVNPSADGAARVLALGPRGVATIVLLRLGRLEPEASRLAQAVAVLGDGASLRNATALAGLDEACAASAVRALEGAEILGGRLDGLRFVHPIVRTSVYEDLTLFERNRLHAAAARLRAAGSASAEELASHLLATDPAGERWVAETLREAARRATALGDPETAVRCLTRALREPPSVADSPAVLAELGSAEASTGAERAEAHLRAAIAAAGDSPLAIESALELATLLKFSARPTAAVDVMRTAEQLPGDPARAEQLQVEMLGIAFISASGYERLHEELAAMCDSGGQPRSHLEAFTLAALAFLDVCARAPYRQVAERAKRAMESGFIPADPTRGGQAFIVATVALIWADELDYVEQLFAAAREDAARRGSAITAASTATMSAMAGYKRGALLEAEGHVQIALQLAEEIVGSQVLSPVIGAYGVLIGLERGADLAELTALIENPAIRHDMDNLPYSQVLPARGMLREAAGDLDSALADFLACDRPVPVWGGKNPTIIPWRGRAALVLHRQGDESEAQRLTEEEVALAREYGAPRPLGIALHNAALVRGESARRELLVEAVDVLERSQARMDLADATIKLGAALRHAGERSHARERLRAGLELAVECGAKRIAELGRRELAALGVRPRRAALMGVGALTPAERRVAELASQGLTNRDIAQALFVTEKTVETHLGHVYDKLGVRSRHKLTQALAA